MYSPSDSSQDNYPLKVDDSYNPEYNAFRPGWTPQAELWNGRLAMIGITAYFLWDLAGYSVISNLFNKLPQISP